VGNDVLGPGRDLRLDLDVLKHRLDHEVTLREVGIFGGRPNQAQQSALLILSGMPAGNGLVEQAGGVGLAVLGFFLIGVQQHHLDAGLRRDVGNARAHHAGAENAEFLHR
jgi:hypothetical protein